MSILLRQTLLEIRLLVRSRDALFWTLAFPAFFIILFGFVYGDTKWDDYDIRAVEYLLPGIIIMAIMTTAINTGATNFAEERDKGIYRRLSVTPLKRYMLIGSQLITRYLAILVQTVLLLLIGIFAFGINIIGNYAVLWLTLTIGSLCFLAIGFSLTTLIKTAKSATPMVMIVFFFLLFLGGVFFPVSMMPTALTYISKALPSTHLNDAIRMIAIEGRGIGDIWSQLVILLGWMAGCLAISIKFFRWG